MRSLAAVLVLALLGAAPAPYPAPSPASDHLTALVGTWTCRDGANAVSTLTFRNDRDAIVAEERRNQPAAETSQRYRRDPATGGWRVDERDAGTGTAPPWSGDAWTIDGLRKWTYNAAAYEQTHSFRYVRAGDDTFYRGVPDPQSPVGVRGEVCARGDMPPDPALCPARDVPPIVLHADEPTVASGPRGRVQVLVSLDAASHVVATKVRSSSDPQLNAPSLDAARRSIFRTGYHDCRPVPSEYTFSVQYQ